MPNSTLSGEYVRFDKILEDNAEEMKGTETMPKISVEKIYESTDGKLLGNAGNPLTVKTDSECHV